MSVFTNFIDFYENISRIKAIIGLDLGEKTIGVAVSNKLVSVASPLETIRRTKFKNDAAQLIKIIELRDIEGIVLGLPINMDGSEGPRCQSTRAFARNLNNLIEEIEIKYQDV